MAADAKLGWQMAGAMKSASPKILAPEDSMSLTHKISRAITINNLYRTHVQVQITTSIKRAVQSLTPALKCQLVPTDTHLGCSPPSVTMTMDTLSQPQAPGEEPISGADRPERETPILETRVLPISINDLGTFEFTGEAKFQNSWNLVLKNSASASHLRAAVTQLRTGSSPVAFPTETVYGLAADATSSAAVQGIYRAKRRPADNPLIVHFASVDHLRSFLDPRWKAEGNLDTGKATERLNGTSSPNPDPIPSIYMPLIERFWPGPLTILLPLPSPSPLAPEVTNSLGTFGARMPSSLLALALIQQTGKPLAAPSANASTKPSPTTAEHVLEDMNGRISIILDGGPCEVGVESTVVDGLSDPLCVLRPGGVGINELRSCSGWENVVNAYETSERSHSQTNGVKSSSAEGSKILADPPLSNPDDAPRAPGMKYRHYSPRAHVTLVDAAAWPSIRTLVEQASVQGMKVGIIRTRSLTSVAFERLEEITIGPSVRDIARGLFAALRELDRRGVDVIFVEGIDPNEGETAEAVMNRLRKAASERISI